MDILDILLDILLKPPQPFIGLFFLITTDLTWPTLTPHQNFTGAICHITPVLNDILDLCRFDLMYLTHPGKISQVHFITLHLC